MLDMGFSSVHAGTVSMVDPPPPLPFWCPYFCALASPRTSKDWTAASSQLVGLKSLTEQAIEGEQRISGTAAPSPAKKRFSLTGSNSSRVSARRANKTRTAKKANQSRLCSIS